MRKENRIRRLIFLLLVLLLFVVVIFPAVCSGRRENEENIPVIENSSDDITITQSPDINETYPYREVIDEDYWYRILIEAKIPDDIIQNVITSILESSGFERELEVILQQDRYTYILVDKEYALPIDYRPNDLRLIEVGTSSFAAINVSLREMAMEALHKMAEAAALEGITFTIGSSFRSGYYQEEVYNRWVRLLEQEEADRVSARPGHSQHQLGLVVDFAPIDNSFANTPAGRWLADNASCFGWSLSYPDGYEHITGYSWESWHYRYVGKELAEFIDKYFDGIQQYALQFIHAWLADHSRQ